MANGSAMAGLGVGTSIIGGVLDFLGSKEASKTQAEAFQKALDLQREIFGQTTENFRPFIEGGTTAFNRLGDLLGGDFSSFQTSPGFQFRQQEGERGVTRNLAALGLAGSGPALKGITRFNQDLASNEFGNFFNRNLSLANLGQSSAAGQAVAGQNFANASSGLLGQQGQARAQGDLALSNAFNTGAQNAMNSLLLASSFGGFGGGGGGVHGGGAPLGRF